MNDAQPGPYQVDHSAEVKDHIQAIKLVAKEAGKLRRFVDILERAVHLLRTDPHGWGDPEYRSQHVDGLYCHAVLRPIAFRYVIYESVRGVVLLSVRLYGEFD